MGSPGRVGAKVLGVRVFGMMEKDEEDRGRETSRGQGLG